ncbi:hypothetical protein GCM10012275_43350 [Longimycelium tulufanense]|uniref:Radical SAM core domain-containing protein n=1 Tax=Longimycelium tulufanense TaxID=907463 RepID=A0A8J3CEP4_9PSEU|nr:radical SAM protein [Longimycelium tulufanense]GGM68130.1 hypothetical protein GCM10012275_43350 [Longimycelium tulufanense]
MSPVPLPTPTIGRPAAPPDAYGFATMPARAHEPDPHRIDRLPYGRFRNLYVYLTTACQLRCAHCYMGERLEEARKMSWETLTRTLRTWRQMGSAKVTLLGGEPTLHPRFVDAIRYANALGYEHVITTTNGLNPAIRKLRTLAPSEFAYVQVSVDGGSPDTHDRVRGTGCFAETMLNIAELAERGFDTRIICTVNTINARDCLRLLDLADQMHVSLVKFHVFSTIGHGAAAASAAMPPREWIEFYEHLEQIAPRYRTRVSYQPTYARRERIAEFAAAGYRGCIGRTLDRMSIFPDGRGYVCSYLFDTDLNLVQVADDGHVRLNTGRSEFDLFTRPLTRPSCGSCKAPDACLGGCPAEEVVMGSASCATEEDIVPVCRLWKSIAVPRHRDQHRP